MTAPRPTPSPGSVARGQGALGEDLGRAMALLVRLLRAGRGLGGEFPEAAVAELRDSLRAAASVHGTFAVELTASALAAEGGTLIALSPTEDVALDRLGRQGVRGLWFGPTVSGEEISTFLAIASLDASPGEATEEDEATRLADCGLVSMGIELAPDPPIAPRAGGEDLEAASEVASLVCSASQGEEGEEGPPPGEHPELASLASALTEAMERLTPWLAGAALPLLDSAAEGDALRLGAMLAAQITADARRAGLGSCKEHLEELEAWLEARRGTGLAGSIQSSVFTPGMRTLALFTLKRDPAGLAGALAVLRCLPRAEQARALTAVCALPPSFARSQAISELVGRERGSAAELLASVDDQAARAMVRSVRDAAFDEGTEALFRAALGYPDELVRSHAVAWLARSSKTEAAAAVDRGLKDPDATVRAATLHALGTVDRELAASALKRWIEGPSFRAAEMEEKRQGALVYAALCGQAALPLLRSLLGRLNVTGDPRVDELRAAGAAGVGLLGDRSSAKRLAKLAKGRRSEALRAEVSLVLDAWAEGRAPYEEPAAQLRELALDLGLVEAAETDGAAPKAGEGRGSDMPTSVEGVGEIDVIIPYELVGESPAPGALQPTDATIEEMLKAYSFDDLPRDGGERWEDEEP